MSKQAATRVALSFGDVRKVAPYELALRAVGLEPVRNPESLDGLQGLVLAGGTDVDPVRYGEERLPETDEPDRDRDEREDRLIQAALRRDIPVLAICRGLQMLNVALGGTLTQHLANTAGHQRRTPDPSERIHDIVVEAGGILREAIGAGTHPVNSRHHQAIARVAPGLTVTATSAGDGVIEAAEYAGKRYVVGVQWHPEDRIRCEADRRLFESFARQAASS
jgi:putative glutamine amidotransferase